MSGLMKVNYLTFIKQFILGNKKKLIIILFVIVLICLLSSPLDTVNTNNIKEVQIQTLKMVINKNDPLVISGEEAKECLKSIKIRPRINIIDIPVGNSYDYRIKLIYEDNKEMILFYHASDLNIPLVTVDGDEYLLIGNYPSVFNEYLDKYYE